MAWLLHRCFLHPTNTAVILDLKRFLINQKLFPITIIVQGESETCPISEIAIIILSLKFIGSFEAAAFSFTNLFFPPSHFSLLSSGHSLCCLPQFALTASRKTRTSIKKFSQLRAQYETLGLIKDYVCKSHQGGNRSKLSKCWLPQLSENPVDCVCGRSLFVKDSNFSAMFPRNWRHFKELQVKGNLFNCSQIWTVASLTYKK